MNINAVTGVDSTQTAAVENNANTSTYFSNYMNQASLSYGDYLEQIFDKASSTYHVSKDLLKAMAKAESSFDAKATSHCGAMGIMQLMPGTAASLGVTNAYDPEQNIMGGAQYISRLLEKYNNNLSYAVAAYNAGSGNVDKYGGIPPFKETQGYVAKVLSYMQEGVTIPGSSTAGTPAAQTASLMGYGNNTAGSGQTAMYGSAPAALSSGQSNLIQELLNKYFDYDDYLEFLQLFTKAIYEKLTGTELGTQLAKTGEEGQKENQKTGQGTQQTVQGTGTIQDIQSTADAGTSQAKVLTMKVKGADGTVNTYRQQPSQNGEAMKAYQYMTAGGQNQMKIFMNKTV